MRETQVQFLGREDPLEKEMAIHSRTLAWKIPWTEETDRLQSMGSQRTGHDWVTSLTHLDMFREEADLGLAFLVPQRLKCMPPMQETQVWSLGLEDPLEKETVTHSSILTWKNPWTGSLAGYSPWGHKELNSTEHSCNPDDYTVRLPWISFVSLQHCTVSVEDNL